MAMTGLEPAPPAFAWLRPDSVRNFALDLLSYMACFLFPLVFRLLDFRAAQATLWMTRTHYAPLAARPAAIFSCGVIGLLPMPPFPALGPIPPPFGAVDSNTRP